MQFLKLLSNASSWHDLNQKLEELTKTEQAKFAGDIFENVCKYFLQTAPQYQTKLKNVLLLKEVKEDLRRDCKEENANIKLNTMYIRTLVCRQKLIDNYFARRNSNKNKIN